jgi:molybdate/tungstate transport system permease protein
LTGRQDTGFKLIFLFLSGVVLLFIIAPLVNLLLAMHFPEFSATLQDREVSDSIFLTLGISFVATLIMAIFAVPLAYILARKNFPMKSLINGIVDLPVVIPHSAAGLALLGVISRDSMLVRNLLPDGMELVGSRVAIGLAMAFVSVPYLINAARDGFAAVPERLEKSAMNLGAAPGKVFFAISLPMAKRSILSGFILMFARGMSEFGAVIMVAYHPMVTPVLIFERFGSFGLVHTRPVAVIFIAICLLVFIVFRLLSGKSGKGGRLS